MNDKIKHIAAGILAAVVAVFIVMLHYARG